MEIHKCDKYHVIVQSLLLFISVTLQQRRRRNHTHIKKNWELVVAEMNPI